MKLLITLFLCLISSGVYAQNAKLFKESSTELVDGLLAKGIDHIGDLDLRDLRKEIKSVKWMIISNAFAAGSGRDRQTAVNLTEQRTVVVNELSLDRRIDPELYAAASLHEALGANGYDDENYELSLILKKYPEATPEQQKILKEQLQKQIELKRSKNKIYENKNRGGTSVGSGGDGTALDLKDRVLDLAMNHPELFDDVDSQQAAIIQILSTAFEPSWDVSKRNLSFEKTEKGIIVTVPSLVWLVLNISNNENIKSEMARQSFERIRGN